MLKTFHSTFKKKTNLLSWDLNIKTCNRLAICRNKRAICSSIIVLNLCSVVLPFLIFAYAALPQIVHQNTCSIVSSDPCIYSFVVNTGLGYFINFALCIYVLFMYDETRFKILSSKRHMLFFKLLIKLFSLCSSIKKKSEYLSQKNV